MAYKVWNPNWSNEAEAKSFDADDPESAVDAFIESEEHEQWEWPDKFHVCALDDDGYFCIIEISAVRSFVGRELVSGPFEYACRLEQGEPSSSRTFRARDARHASILFAEYLYAGAEGVSLRNEEYMVLVIQDKESIRPSQPMRFLVSRSGEEFKSTRTQKA